jgi:hypothetical protein
MLFATFGKGLINAVTGEVLLRTAHSKENCGGASLLIETSLV